MKLTYDELLEAYENTNKQMLELLNELTDNGVIVSINAGLVENVDIHETVFSKKYTMQTSSKLDFSEHDKIFTDKIAELEERVKKSEGKETVYSEDNPIKGESAPSIGWYDNRHQSDCIEINRLNTTIDVLIHKVEYLRHFAGL